MEIRDLKSKYVLKVDTQRNIVYEKQLGYWKPEDVGRFHNDYVSKIQPLIKGKVWAKCCDFRNYKTSMITKEIQNHVEWASENGLVKAAIIIDYFDKYSSVIEKQMHIGIKSTPIELRVFADPVEADEWLKGQGF